ncbi:MAG: hypothetical protein CMH83_19340 [Nocardioides sp.]|nr:hypothetical protein [Nocardioides sp.]
MTDTTGNITTHDQPTNRPTAKVTAATLGAGAGAIVSDFAVWGLDELFWNGPADPTVPAPVAAFTTLLITSGLALAAGYFKRERTATA